MEITICCIVEGHGEVEALPILIRRIAYEVAPEVDLHLPRPIRLPRTKLKNTNELSRAVKLAKLNSRSNGDILILMDADDDYPAKVAPDIISKVQPIVGKLALSVVMPNREYEAWFLAGIESLAGLRGLETQIVAPSDPEKIRGAKEWLGRHMPQNRKYAETLDQAAFSSRLNLSTDRSSPSFDKLYRDISSLIKTADLISD